MTTTATTSADRSDRTSFPLVQGRARGYDRDAVDEFLARARRAFEGDGPDTLTAQDIRRVAFPLARHGYAIAAVDAALARIEDAFAAREREDALAHGGVEEWVGATRETAQEVLDRLTRRKGRRFDRVSALRYGYRIDEVDLVGDKLARYLADGEPVSVEQVRSVAFRMQRGGYREAQVDAVLDAVVDVMLAVR
ncbi:DivIVA domain-containing protein [Microbacterium xanthum]|uniref:DivIVA domain-containing protein n=1 Tax=Microbacterium xanthum TaxID=3079794 RepID=UPI002AD2D141|nr:MULTISPECIES: DivIVA domain-containing protein [unclassified Microbacterium]MDZ8172346.1 DivIVA domain-containing protein [Microbacterium sp. KSW-48]MDZ8201936.1 DivIVA domain-containing protein [Microbacterium sp. SSW1-59]